MQVLLFDIDGTLLSTGGAGRAALDTALREVFSLQPSGKIDVDGKTDRGIAANLFAQYGIDNTEEHWRAFQRVYLRALPEHMADLQGVVLPGVRRLLEQLVKEESVRLGLLTGNVRAGASIKLDFFRLGEFFSFGGFGDHHADRNLVAADALQATREHLSRDVQAEHVSVIGDTPRDIACAKSIGARAIAVTTGNHDRETLEAAEPDLVLDDLDGDHGWWQ